MDCVIVKENKRYVKVDINGKPTLTTNITLANKFTKSKAEAFLQNCIKPAERSSYTILDTDEEDNVIDSAFNDYSEIENIDIADICSKMEIVLSQINAYKDILQKKLTQIEKEKVDIDHRIEFPKDNGKEFNAVEMVSLFKFQREVLRNRRNIKDKILMLDIVMLSSQDDFKSGRVSKRIKGLDNRTYVPRVLNELFA